MCPHVLPPKAMSVYPLMSLGPHGVSLALHSSIRESPLTTPLISEHSNYFGVDEKLGPVAVSIRRERLEDHREHGPQYQYRLIFRTSEVRCFCILLPWGGSGLS